MGRELEQRAPVSHGSLIFDPGALLGCLGAVLGSLGAVLALSWGFWGCLALPSGCLGAVMASLGAVFGILGSLATVMGLANTFGHGMYFAYEKPILLNMTCILPMKNQYFWTLCLEGALDCSWIFMEKSRIFLTLYSYENVRFPMKNQYF